MRKYNIKSSTELEDLVNSVLRLQKTLASGAVRSDCDGYSRGVRHTFNGSKESYVTYDGLIAEAKFTEKSPSSISVKKADMYKTQKAASRLGRIPIMVRGDISGEVYVIISLDDFAFIYNRFLDIQT